MAAHPHQTRNANQRWTRWLHTHQRCWRARHSLTEGETRTRGNGATHPPKARCVRGMEVVAGTAQPIESETRTMGGGSWRSRTQSKARRGRWVEVAGAVRTQSNARRERSVVVAGTAHPIERVANDGGCDGWHTTNPSNARSKRWVLATSSPQDGPLSPHPGPAMASTLPLTLARPSRQRPYPSYEHGLRVLVICLAGC